MASIIVTKSVIKEERALGVRDNHRDVERSISLGVPDFHRRILKDWTTPEQLEGESFALT